MHLLELQSDSEEADAASELLTETEGEDWEDKDESNQEEWASDEGKTENQFLNFSLTYRSLFHPSLTRVFKLEFVVF